MPAVVAGRAGAASRAREQVLTDLLEVRTLLVDPDGCDPALSRRPSSGPDALELNAACLALPEYAREAGVAGTPLLWSWPSRTYPAGGDRRTELLQAAALLIAAVERLDSRTRQERRLRIVEPARSQQ